MNLRSVSLLVCAVLAGCSSDGPDRVAGGGSDQPNKIEAGRILMPEGAAAVGAEVVSWAGTWDPIYSSEASVGFDTAKTDSTGAWKLEVPKDGRWFVTARMPGYEGYLLPGQNVATLSQAAIAKGVVKRRQGMKIESVWMGGVGTPLAIQWQNDSVGTFDLSLFPGPRRIWAKVGWFGGTDSVLVAERVFRPGANPALELDPDTASTLLVSADAFPARSSLRGVDFDAHDLDAAKWYAFSDSFLGGTSQLWPAGFPDLDTALRMSGTVGRYFEWRMLLGDTLRFDKGKVWSPFVGVGIRLSKRDLDWSNVKALRIACNGGDGKTGHNSVWVQLNSSEIDQLGTSEHLRFKLELPTGWSVQNIPVEAFLPPKGSKAEALGYDWGRIKRSIHDIVFFAGDSETVLQVKEVRALGGRFRDW